MKIRQGFVSNSSTTSFCIYGAYINSIPNDPDCDDLYEACEEVGLTYHSAPYDTGGWVGVEWCMIGDDETGNQFKARAEVDLAKLGIKPEDCGTHEEAWRDG